MVGARPRFRDLSGGGRVLGAGLREPAWLSFGSSLVGRLSRPSSQHPPPASRSSSARHVFKGKGKARQKQSKARQGPGGQGLVGHMMGFSLLGDR